MKASIINLTPHEINEVSSGKSYPPSGIVARLAVTSTEVGTLEGAPLFVTKYGEVEGLPPKTPGVAYLVSGILLDALKNQGRDDLVAPGDLVRDARGQPIGCRGFKIMLNLVE